MLKVNAVEYKAYISKTAPFYSVIILYLGLYYIRYNTEDTKSWVGQTKTATVKNVVLMNAKFACFIYTQEVLVISNDPADVRLDDKL